MTRNLDFRLRGLANPNFGDFETLQSLDQTQSIRIRIIEEVRTVVKVVYVAFGVRLSENPSFQMFCASHFLLCDSLSGV